MRERKQGDSLLTHAISIYFYFLLRQQEQGAQDKKKQKKQVHSPHQISHHNSGKRAEEREQGWGGAKGKKQKGPRKEKKGRIGADRE